MSGFLIGHVDTYILLLPDIGLISIGGRYLDRHLFIHSEYAVAVIASFFCSLWILDQTVVGWISNTDC
jgi:fumarate reductase subunit C